MELTKYSIGPSLPDFLRDERIGSGQFELANFYLSLLFFGFKCLVHVFMFTSKSK